MKWRGRRGSQNIEDRRGDVSWGGGGGWGGGAPVGPRRRGGRVSLLGAVVVIGLALFFGVDPTVLLTGGGPAPQPSGRVGSANDDTSQFVSVVLADTEEVWSDLFARGGGRYQAPKLVLFSGSTDSACGYASAATGPFYCPNDRKVFLDADFFRTLERDLGARGDFARAYVIAHEVGHHVQNLLGVLDKTNRLRAQMGETEANAVSVRVELQADCYAGLWARGAESMFGSLEPGDIDKAMAAAGRIGDDELQRGAGRVVTPDSFTHGSSAQRARWFRRGYEGGGLDSCDTFGAARL